MAISVRSVGIYAGDQDRAKAFWTQTMDLELLQDVPMGEEVASARWIEVKPPEQTSSLFSSRLQGRRAKSAISEMSSSTATTSRRLTKT